MYSFECPAKKFKKEPTVANIDIKRQGAYVPHDASDF